MTEKEIKACSACDSRTGQGNQSVPIGMLLLTGCHTLPSAEGAAIQLRLRYMTPNMATQLHYEPVVESLFIKNKRKFSKSNVFEWITSCMTLYRC